MYMGRIPIFTSQLEKAREATDAANIRAAYAEVVSSALTDPDKDHEATVTAVQTQPKWQNTSIENIGGAAVGDSTGQIAAVTKTSTPATWTISYTASNGKVTIGGVEVKTTFTTK